MTDSASAPHQGFTRADFWAYAQLASPVLALAAVWGFSGFFHIFDGVPFVGRELTPLQALLIGCGMFWPFAAFLHARSEWGIAQARASRAWPTASGVILSSEMSSKYIYRRGMSYTLDVSYRYEAGGVDYIGDRVGFGRPRVYDEGFITRRAELYRPGAAIVVHYDPADPASAVIETSEESVRGYVSTDKYFAGMFFLLPTLFWLVLELRAIFS